MRPNEILQLKWSDVSINITDTKETRRFSGYSRSGVRTPKQGRMRSVNGPVGEGWKVEGDIEKLGFPVVQTNTSSETPIQGKRSECPLSQHSITKRLTQVLEETDLRRNLMKVEDISLSTHPDTSTLPWDYRMDWISIYSPNNLELPPHTLTRLTPHSSRDKHRDYSGYVLLKTLEQDLIKDIPYTTKQTPKKTHWVLMLDLVLLTSHQKSNILNKYIQVILHTRTSGNIDLVPWYV